MENFAVNRRYPVNEPFYMVSLEVLSDRVMALGKRRGLPLRVTDNGYLVHTAFGELFGDLAPRPFAIQGNRGRKIRILGYTDNPLNELRHQADAVADPTVHSTCDWESAAAKPMPQEWKPGGRFGFEIRVCPVVRRSGEGPRGERPGREMDVFLAHVEGAPEAPSTREDVYINWLRAAIDRNGGAQLEDAHLTGFSLQQFIRRDSQRKPRQVPNSQNAERGGAGRPDATLAGTISVADSSKFGSLLRHGIGRHRGFGFGMILLTATS
jgi:CRISPR system Cascade subunit CasE